MTIRTPPLLGLGAGRIGNWGGRGRGLMQRGTQPSQLIFRRRFAADTTATCNSDNLLAIVQIYRVLYRSTESLAYISISTPISTMKTFSKYALAAACLATTTSAFAPALSGVQKATANTQLFSTVDDKTEVREYFNNEGFNR